jgi:predicted nucleic acid-binding protein
MRLPNALKNAIFIDAGAFIALADRSDQFHEKAGQAMLDVEAAGPRVTTPFVLVESCNYLQRRVNAEAGCRLWNSILSGEAQVKLLPVDDRDLARACQIATQYADQAFSWVDCASFACIERLKISRVFSFDKDFLIFKFSHGPLHRIP